MFSFLEAGLKTAEAAGVGKRPKNTQKATPAPVPVSSPPPLTPKQKNKYENLVNIKSTSGEREQQTLETRDLLYGIEKGLEYYLIAFDINQNLKFSKSNNNAKRFQEKQTMIQSWNTLVDEVLKKKLAEASEEEIKNANKYLNKIAAEVFKHPKTLEYVNKLRKMIKQRKGFQPANSTTPVPNTPSPQPNSNQPMNKINKQINLTKELQTLVQESIPENVRAKLNTPEIDKFKTTLVESYLVGKTHRMPKPFLPLPVRELLIQKGLKDKDKLLFDVLKPKMDKRYTELTPPTATPPTATSGGKRKTRKASRRRRMTRRR
jgi:hypothetical protein